MCRKSFDAGKRARRTLESLAVAVFTLGAFYIIYCGLWILQGR